MDGLECSEIELSTIKIENEEFRIDSEYISKNNVFLDKKISALTFDYIGDFAYVTDGIHESIYFDDDSNINLISAKSPKENIFDLSGNGYISEQQHKANPRTALKINDIIISTVGTIGNCAVVDEKIMPANSDRHVGIIRILEKYKPHYVSTFILSKYGRFQTSRHVTGNVQPNLFLDKIRKFKIPIASDRFQSEIENFVVSALSLLDKSKNIYIQSEQLILSELDIVDFNPSSEAISVKPLSESFLLSGRLDAEYYQPKYEEYLSHIQVYKYGYVTVAEAFKLVNASFKKEKTEYLYIEIGDINVGDGSFSYNVVAAEDLPANAKIKVDFGDMLVSKVRPYRGAVSIINSHIDDLVASGAFTVLRQISDYPIETLSVLFKTAIYKDWFLKWNVGSSYPVIKDDDVLNIQIPLFKEPIHNQIIENIKKAANLRQQSQQLLELAKQAVEMFVEHDEEKAIEWLKMISAKDDEY